MIKASLMIVIGIGLSLLFTQVEAGDAGETLDICAFQPTFVENFQNFTVSPWGDGHSRWIAHTPWSGDFGDAAFTDPKPGFPFRVEGGILHIEARKSLDGKWRSGLLASADPQAHGFSQRYGYFEMKARLPKGPGLWPAFWLASALPKGAKETSVEVDVIEQYGKFPSDFHSVLHVWSKDGKAGNKGVEHVTPVATDSLYEGFHTYGADVEADTIKIYLDRKMVWQVPTPLEHVHPLMMLVDLGMGSGWPIDQTPNPSIMDVEYIHAYRPVNATNNKCP